MGFDLCLLEMIVISIHNLAIYIFKECHPNGGPHEDNMGPNKVPALKHPQYDNYPQYPNDTVEVVGYFAETMMFGGVILFDRGDSGVEVLFQFPEIRNVSNRRANHKIIEKCCVCPSTL